MKKTVFLIGIFLLFGIAKLRAYPLDVGIYKTTDAIAGVGLNGCKLSTANLVFVDYLVLSTGGIDQSLEIYDAQQSTLTALKSWTKYPINTYGTAIPLGIEVTTGAFVCIPTIAGDNLATNPGRARLRYYIKSRGQ